MAEEIKTSQVQAYGDDSIVTLEWNEHIRRRLGMYIGRKGDGSVSDDGIYVLLKEIIDNSIDEFTMGFGKNIVINVTEKSAEVRDYGRGIPLGSVVKATSQLNTGGRFDDSVFVKSIGLNGVGMKAVNALSTDFYICAYRDGECSWAKYSKGELLDSGRGPTSEKNGTLVQFTPDDTIFIDYAFRMDIIEKMIKNYSFLKKGLTLTFNDVPYLSKNGLLDLVLDDLDENPLYEPIHLQGDDLEIVLTHTSGGGTKISSFANGQFTRDGGTHLDAYREAIGKALTDFFSKKNFTPEDCRQGVLGAISVQIQEPNFEGQTKTKLGSKYMWQKGDDFGPTVRSYIVDFLCRNLDNYLRINKKVAEVIEAKLKDSQKEREEINEIRSKNKSNKSAHMYNANLNDCRYHFNMKGAKGKEKYIADSSILITEGKSASGTVNKARDANFQAVFSIRGKSKNSYRSNEAGVIENAELSNLVGALGIGDSLDNLRYNRVIIATDADDDGMHIRLLLVTFFLKYYPELVQNGHLHILETPLFRVRSKKANRYCYDTAAKLAAIEELSAHGEKVEITRFKGLGEIGEKEFKDFIGDNMRLENIQIAEGENIPDLLRFYMGPNSLERQEFIIKGLRSSEELEGTDIDI